jgi:5-methyltetrahydrofolate--homocysteine methyltransferase
MEFAQLDLLLSVYCRKQVYPFTNIITPMRSSLSALLQSRSVILTDGATGTNYMLAGLGAGEPPEFWNLDRPEEVLDLHRRFIDAGAEIILTNTFGCNRHRLKLHKAENRVYELAKRAAELARQIADAAPRPVVVAGSVGPTGELFQPLGDLTHEAALDSFEEQIRGLRDGGTDVVWIETLSSTEELNAAAEASIRVGLPYVVTCTFDTAGRTMMGVLPSELDGSVSGQPVAPLAIGANCGVGASDILATLLHMQQSTHPLVVKGNCGVPHFEGTECVYSGTPEQMARYATLAVDAGARIVGGCCGTTAAHVAAMRAAIDKHVRGARPTIETIIQEVGPLVNAPPSASVARPARRSRR